MRNWEVEDEKEPLKAEEINRDANILVGQGGGVNNQKLPFSW